jgi:pimeloyl-ACP methyl ester carboxylesterase
MISRTTVPLENANAVVWSGGSGEPLLLVHGGWCGAEMHWHRVWDRLGEQHRVIAPELPGIGDRAQAALPSFGAYGRWLDALLGRLEIPSAWVVGNSFGAAVSYCLATEAPARCRGLVLVNGGPVPSLPKALRLLLGAAPIARVVKSLVHRLGHGPSALTRAFVDPGNAPAELVSLLAGRAQESRRMVDLVAQMLLAPEPPLPPPSCPVLLLWGADDQLSGTGAEAAGKLVQQLPGAELVPIDGAGHFPQLEQPERFVAELERFVARDH